MITLLAKFFIKKGMDEIETRKAYGMLCGIVGIFLNIILFTGKLLAGLFSGSIAITADAFNNLSDAGSSIVTLLGFKIAGQKPDSDHPFGHGRVEYIAGFIVSALILAMGITLVKDSITKIIHPEPVEYSIVLIIILAASILVKSYMAIYNFMVGKKVSSVAIKAAGTDSISDCISTAVILGATLFSHYSGIQIDAYCGVLVGVMVTFAGFSAAKDTLNPLLGQPPEKEFVDKISEITLNYNEKICGMHDLLVHDYGPGRRFVSLHAEMPADSDVLELHDIIDNLERVLQAELGCFVTVHMDPIITNDPKVAKLKEQLISALHQLDYPLSIHDFRVVFGETHTNLLFDVLVPIDLRKEDSEIKADVQKQVHECIGKEYFSVIDVDRDYTVTLPNKKDK